MYYRNVPTNIDDIVTEKFSGENGRWNACFDCWPSYEKEMVVWCLLAPEVC